MQFNFLKSRFDGRFEDTYISNNGPKGKNSNELVSLGPLFISTVLPSIP